MWSYEECVAIDSWLEPHDPPPAEHYPCRRCGTPATSFVEILPTVDPIPLCNSCTDEHYRQEAEA